MRNFLLFCLLSFVLVNVRVQAEDPVVININGEEILRSEFEYIWKKNNTENSLDKKNLDEYLDLFVIFKLKVAEAKAQGLDTTQAFISELRGYRNQLTAPYLTDKQAEEKLIDEAYAFMNQYVDLSHILIPLDKNAAPQDSLAVYNKLMELRSRILNGKILPAWQPNIRRIIRPQTEAASELSYVPDWSIPLPKPPFTVSPEK